MNRPVEGPAAELPNSFRIEPAALPSLGPPRHRPRSLAIRFFFGRKTFRRM